MNLFDLAAKITLDSKGYEDGLKNAENEGATFGQKLKSGLGTAAKIGGVAITAIGTAAVATGKKLYSEVSEVAQYGDEVDKMSQKLGLSTEAYQEWDYVLGQAGVDITSMSTGLKTLTNKLDDAKNGSEESLAMFNRLGLSLEDLQHMTREEVFEAAIYGFQGMADSTERAALANDLFGKSGQELTPLFNSTIEETKELQKAAHSLGMVMSEEDVKASAEFKDSMDTMKRTFDGLKRNMTSQFLPAFSGVFKNISGLLTSSGKDAERYQKGLAKNFGKIATNLMNELPKFINTAGKIGMALIDALVSTISKNSGKILRTGIKAVKELATGLVSQIPNIMSGIGSIIGGVITSIPDLLGLAWNIVKGLGEGIIKSIPKIAEGIWDGFKGLFTKPLSEEAQDAIDEVGKLEKKLSEVGMSSDEMYEKLSGVDVDTSMAEYWAKVFDDLHNKTELTKEEQALLNQAVAYLNENVLPDTAQIVQDETGKWQGNTEAIYKNIAAMKARKIAEVYLEKAQGDLEKIAMIQIEIDKQNDKIFELEGKKNKLTPQIEEINALYETLSSDLSKVQESTQSLYPTWEQGTDAMRAYAESIGLTEETFGSWDRVMQTVIDRQQSLGEELKSVDEGIASSTGVIKTLENQMDFLNRAVDKNMAKFGEWSARAEEESQKVGHALGDGLAIGIKSKTAVVERAAGSLATAALNRMKYVASIASPSKRARKEIGEMIGKGLSFGLEDEIGEVEKASEKLSNAAMPDYSGSDYNYQTADVETMPERPIYLVLDSGELVGKTVRKYDEALGTENTLKLRFGGAMA